MAAGYVNPANLGIPIAQQVLGNMSFPAEVILFQLLVVMTVLTTLDRHGDATGPIRHGQVLSRLAGHQPVAHGPGAGKHRRQNPSGQFVAHGLLGWKVAGCRVEGKLCSPTESHRLMFAQWAGTRAGQRRPQLPAAAITGRRPVPTPGRLCGLRGSVVATQILIGE